MAATPGNPNQEQQQSSHFDINNLFKPSPSLSSNLTTSPSFPVPPCSLPTFSPSTSYPPPTGTFPYYPHYLPYQEPQQIAPSHNFYPLQLQNRPQSAAVPSSQTSVFSCPSPSSPHLPSPPNLSTNTDGARLMALLSNPNPPSNLDGPQQQSVFAASSPSTPSSAHAVSEFSVPTNSGGFSSSSSAPLLSLATPQPTPIRMLSSKLPKGRHLVGDNVVYDIDVRLPGEVQPQLEVTPITKYASDPGLVLGRQIAVNKSYICYGLKLGAIRVLNINTALRSLLRGHTQRVSDMAFFADDLHLLASASVDGRVFIWKIIEGPDVEDKPQITGKIVLAIQVAADVETVHPRMCWHSHKQEILMVAVGNCILKIDTTKAGRGGTFSAEEPLQCSVDKLIDGVQLVGKHDGNITDMAMCQWMKSRLATASIDGTVKIWEDRKPMPLVVLKPHDGKPVNSATFLTAPHRPDHIVLITAGPLNKEVKIWTSDSEEGCLLPSDTESWTCTQTLEIKTSSGIKDEDVFFNQGVALPGAGLFLLANAKKNAIYAIHIEYGANPASTRLDYIAEFTVTMPILSLTATSDSLPDGDHVVQIYCVQTQAIQQYALNLSQCLPPLLDNETGPAPAMDAYDQSVHGESSTGNVTSVVSVSKVDDTPTTPSQTAGSDTLERLSGNLASSEVSSLLEASSSAAKIKPIDVLSRDGAENVRPVSPSIPSSPRLSAKLSGFSGASNNFENVASTNRSSDLTNHSSDRRTDSDKDGMQDKSVDSFRSDKFSKQNDISVISNSPSAFKHPTHLVTPSEIFSTAASSSDKAPNSQVWTEAEAKVQDPIVKNDEEKNVEVKVVGEIDSNQDNFEHQRDSSTAVTERKEKAFYSQASDLGFQVASEYRMGTGGTDKVYQADNYSNIDAVVQPIATVNEEAQSLMKDIPEHVSESETHTVVSDAPAPATRGSPSVDALPQLLTIQEMLGQLIIAQKEMQKQVSAMVSVPVTREGKRLEGVLGRYVERVVKANSDALWAHMQEENAKQQKLERDQIHHITNMINNCINKDLHSMLEKAIKKEIASMGQTIGRSVGQVIEKSISSAVAESFQKGIGDKALNQLEMSVGSKLDATVSRQIQAQFQASGKQTLQDALRTSLETSIIPAFEMSCKAMFEQMDVTFQKGVVKHITSTQQQYESAHSPLAIALRDAINSASSITQKLIGELADGRQLLALAASGSNSKAVNPLVTQLTNGLHDAAEVTLDPTKHLSRLVAEGKYEEAFTVALHRSDVSIVSWLCSQVDLQRILSLVPLPLSQGVLLSLLQQLSCDISTETSRKLAWMTDVAAAINPSDPMIAMHVRPIFEQVYQMLSHQRNLPTTTPSEASSIRLLIHVINSVLMNCK